MRMRSNYLSSLVSMGIAAGSALLATTAGATELVAFALMPANTFAVGPTSGQFAGAGAGGNTLPLLNKQPVQGISAVLEGPNRNAFYVMPDNGFGAQNNSQDALLRIYAVRPEFKTWTRGSVVGSGTVSPAHFRTGTALPAFTEDTFISLRDPNQRLGFPIVASGEFYPFATGTVPVDPSIKAGRLLTGADFDIEAVRVDRARHFWFGEEFGPFLVETDRTGKVLHAEFRTPNLVPPGSTSTGTEVRSPQNPYLAGETPNLARSNGFEGLAISPSAKKLYTLIEGTVAGDNAVNATTGKNLRINEFDVRRQAYTGHNWLYQLEADGTNIGDMTAIDEHRFLVIERNGSTATSGTPFKKIFIADIKRVADGGFAKKTELVNLMDIQDPHDLNADGNTLFTFPFTTIESVLILDARTLLVINDNNYPGAGGRDLNSDNTEFLKLRLDTPLFNAGCGF